MSNHHSHNYNQTQNQNQNQNNKQNSILEDSKKIHICRNCGLTGHIYKACPHPIVSFGLICFRYIRGIPEYLMIQRKDSLSFMEFVRGKYDPIDIKYISKLLSHMTSCERNMLLRKTFEELWNHIWFQKTIQRHTTDYDDAQKRFQEIYSGVNIIDSRGNKKIYTLASLIGDTITPFTEPEWGFPKGRRRPKEADVACAVREFCEETGFSPSDVQICNSIKPFEEIFYGTNSILYRHVYFIAELITNREREIVVDPSNVNQAREVQQVAWFNFQNVLGHIRSHNSERKEIFTCAHTAVSRMCG